MTARRENALDHVLRDIVPGAIRLRRELHKIPEIAWQEKKTSTMLRSWLRARSVSSRAVAGTGVLARVASGKGKTVAIRSDLDGLPVQEQTGLPFKSVHAGRMHACGHDVHMAVVAGSAAVLQQMRSSFRGLIKVIFQPAEEEPPGGAQELIRAGVMRNPKVDMVFGLHVNSGIAAGKIGVRNGPLMAGVIDFDVDISGRGGHVALPHLTDDVLACGATTVTALQAIVPRGVDPLEPTVVSVGKMESGTARNVLPPACKLYGTARALNEVTLKKLRDSIKVVTKSVAAEFGCSAKLTFFDGYPPLINDEEAVAYLAGAARKALGSRSVTTIRNPFMGGEDFARYLEHAPGAMFHLGVRNRKIGAIYGWHNPKFVADENAIEVGIRTLVNAAVDFLND
jgi:amidohydrolase